MTAQLEGHFGCRKNEVFRLPDTVSDPTPQEFETATLSIGCAAQQTIIREIICGMERADYAIREQAAVEFALTEALANALEHGGGHDPRKTIRLWYKVDDKRVWIRVADEGPGFAVNQVPDPTVPENLSRTSGRGLLLIRKFMDEVEHNDCGNGVTMVKFRSAAGSGQVDLCIAGKNSVIGSSGKRSHTE